MTIKQNPFDVYTQVGVKTAVASASPHQLITLLIEKALSEIAIARRAILEGDLNSKGVSISKAISIISELKTILNLEVGGELAENLSRLYEYMNRKLIEANINNGPDFLDETHRLLSEIKEAWTAIKEGPRAVRR